MEYIIITLICCIGIILLKFIFNINIKELKHLATNEYLDNITNTLPDSEQVCLDMLKNLNNDSVKVEKSENNSKSSLYLIIGNKIIIGNIKDSFTRIQTIAHECLHSVQDKSLLLFNFIYSNIYILYFLIITVLTIFGIIYNCMIYLLILIFLSLIYCVVRNYLETDAMIKAKYLAKDYLNNQPVLNNEVIEDLIMQYDSINKIGIKATNYSIFLNVALKILIYCVIAFIRINIL